MGTGTPGGGCQKPGGSHGVRERLDWGVRGLPGHRGGIRAPRLALLPLANLILPPTPTFLSAHPESCPQLILPGPFKSCPGTGAREGAGRAPRLPLTGASAPPPPAWKALLEVVDARVRVSTAGLGVRLEGGGEGARGPGVGWSGVPAS